MLFLVECHVYGMRKGDSCGSCFKRRYTIYGRRWNVSEHYTRLRWRHILLSLRDTAPVTTSVVSLNGPLLMQSPVIGTTFHASNCQRCRQSATDLYEKKNQTDMKTCNLTKKIWLLKHVIFDWLKILRCGAYTRPWLLNVAKYSCQTIDIYTWIYIYGPDLSAARPLEAAGWYF